MALCVGSIRFMKAMIAKKKSLNLPIKPEYKKKMLSSLTFPNLYSDTSDPSLRDSEHALFAALLRYLPMDTTMSLVNFETIALAVTTQE